MIKSLSFKKRILSSKVSLRRIYAPTVGKVAVFLALYQDDCLIAHSITEYGEMVWKNSETKTPSLEVPIDGKEGKLWAELYFIDAETFGRPLSKVLRYEL